MDKHREFLTLFLKSQADLRAFIASMVRDRQVREDLLQDVALVLWEKFSEYDPARPFGAWARGIAAHKIMQMWEKSKRTAVSFAPDVVQAVLDAYDRSEPEGSLMQEVLHGCLGRLKEFSRRLLRLRYEESLKLDEIAARVQGTRDAVHKALSRVRDFLQRCVEHQMRLME